MDEEVLPWSTAALPTVVVAGRYPLDDREFAFAYRGSTHSLHVYDYEGWIRFGDQPERALKPGDATLSPAGGVTRYHLPRPGRHWCVHFLPVVATGAPCSLPLLVSLGGLRPRIIDTIARISGLMALPEAEGSLARAAASAAMQELLLTIAGESRRDSANERARRSESAVSTAAALIDADLPGAVSVLHLAKRVGLSPNWLATAFRRRFGTTVLHYRLARRIEHAQLLLLTTDLPVARIGQRLGFHDPQHFDKQFRRMAGCAPGTFRRRGGGS